MKVKIDDMDLKILGELRTDSKRPVRELSKILGMHPNTLLQRIKRLEKNGFVSGYSAKLDYRALGYDIHAIVMIKNHKGVLEGDKYLLDLTKIPEVECVYSIMGSSDCMAMVRAKNRDDLVRVLKILQNHKNVIRTTSHLVLVSYKEHDSFNPFSAMKSVKK